MPLYDFRCKKCHHNFEDSVLLSELDKKIILCPKCSHDKTERLITNPTHYKHLSWAKWKV